MTVRQRLPTAAPLKRSLWSVPAATISRFADGWLGQSFPQITPGQATPVRQRATSDFHSGDEISWWRR